MGKRKAGDEVVSETQVDVASQTFAVAVPYGCHCRAPSSTRKVSTWTPICGSFLGFLWILVRFMVRNPQKELQMGVQESCFGFGPICSTFHVVLSVLSGVLLCFARAFGQELAAWQALRPCECKNPSFRV